MVLKVVILVYAQSGCILFRGSLWELMHAESLYKHGRQSKPRLDAQSPFLWKVEIVTFTDMGTNPSVGAHHPILLGLVLEQPKILFRIFMLQPLRNIFSNLRSLRASMNSGTISWSICLFREKQN